MSSFGRVLADYFQRVDDGRTIDPDQFIADYPTHAAELQRFFENLGVLQSAVDRAAATPSLDRTLDLPQLGDFRICREIGRGGMGVVYEAEQLALRRRVAVKVLHAAAASDVRRLIRFKNEVQAIAALRHDHIVPVIAVGEQDGHHYYAMQLIDGFPLSQIQNHVRSTMIHPETMPDGSIAIDANEPSRSATNTDERSLDSIASQVSSDNERLRCQRVGRLVETVARTLHYAHEQGVVHRDIKPSNLLVDHQGKVWVTDFGLAHLEHEATITVSGEVVGTVQYMSPEQAMGRRELIDRRTDIYSLGVLLYWLLTHELPFRGQPRMVLRQSLNDDPTSPRKLNHRIPADLETICLKCLEKQPAHRYATAWHLAEDLHRWREDRPISAKPATPLKRGLKWVRRRPAVATSLGVVVLAILLVFGLSLRYTHRLTALNESLSDTVLEKDRALVVAKERAWEIQEQNYGRSMVLGMAAWRNKRRGEAEQLLSEQIPSADEPDHRGAEWYLLQQLLQRKAPTELRGHTGPVQAIAVFDSGRRLASVGDDATIRIWNLETNEQECVLKDDRPTRVLEADTPAPELIPGANIAEPIPVSVMGPGYRSVAVSPDGEFLVTGNLVLSLWNLRERRWVRDLTVFETRIYGVAFSPDGQTVAVQGADVGVRVVDLDGGELRRFETNHGSFGLFFTPDAEVMVAPYQSADQRTGGIRFWDTQSWELVREIPTDKPRPISLSGDTKFMAVGFGNRAEIVEYATGRVITSLRVESSVNDVSISPDCRSLAICLADGTLAYSNHKRNLADERARLATITHSIPAHLGCVNAVRFIDNWRMVTCGNDGVVRVWTTEEPSGPLVFRYDGVAGRGPIKIVPSTSCKVALATDTGFAIVDPQAGLVETNVTLWEPGHGITSALDVVADGRVVCGSDEGWLAVWDLHSGREMCRVQQTPGRGINDARWSPDGSLVAIASTDHTVRIRSASDLNEVKNFAVRGHGKAVAFAPDGDQLAFADSESSLWTVNTRTWTDLTERRVDSPIATRCICYAVDGSMLVTGHTERTITVWDPNTLEENYSLVGPATGLWSLSLHPDGKTLVACRDNLETRLWHLPTRSDLGAIGRADASVFSDEGFLVSFKVLKDQRGTLTVMSTRQDQPVRPSVPGQRTPCPSLDEETSARHAPLVADVNGDSAADLIGFNAQGTWVCLSRGDGFQPPVKWSDSFVRSTEPGDLCQRMMADINGDGKQDIVSFAQDGHAEYAVSLGERFAPSQSTGELGTGKPWNPEHPRALADVTGDGRADIVAIARDQVFVSESLGDNFAPPRPWLNAVTATADLLADEHIRQVADINGDGMADLVAFTSNGVNASRSLGDRFSDVESWSPGFTFPKGSLRWHDAHDVRPRVLVDVTGDGCADVVGTHHKGVDVSVSNGASFVKSGWWSVDFNSTTWTPDTSLWTTADINGDARADLVAFASFGTAVALSTGNGFAPFTVLDDFEFLDRRVTSNPQWRILADMNGDGRDDVVGIHKGRIRVSLSRGAELAPASIWATVGE